MSEKTEQGLMTQLVEALGALLSEAESAAGHVISMAARGAAHSALARTTPEGVRKADAAEEMWCLLEDGLRAHPNRGNTRCSDCAQARAIADLIDRVQPGRVAEIDDAIAKAERP